MPGIVSCCCSSRHCGKKSLFVDLWARRVQLAKEIFTIHFRILLNVEMKYTYKIWKRWWQHFMQFYLGKPLSFPCKYSYRFAPFRFDSIRFFRFHWPLPGVRASFLLSLYPFSVLRADGVVTGRGTPTGQPIESIESFGWLGAGNLLCNTIQCPAVVKRFILLLIRCKCGTQSWARCGKHILQDMM